MINYKILGISLTFFIIASHLSSCSKFLDEKPESSLSVPETMKDLRAIMDNEEQINRYAAPLLEMGSDDIYVRPEVLKARPEIEQLIYTWTRSEFRSDLTSWIPPYKAIMASNVVLEALERGVKGTRQQESTIHGEALFVRAYAYLSLTQIFCKPYDSETSKQDLGLALRLTSDFNEKVGRSKVEDAYSLIIDDLKKAITLLPEQVEAPTRPTKAAAYAALSRTYLYMNRFEEANEAAKKALNYNDKLIDYADLDVNSPYPMGIFHDEIIYHSHTSNGLLLAVTRALIPQELYEMYPEKDLRKNVFFSKSSNGDIVFKGYYTGRVSSFFAGIATDEMYLIRAECEARIGSIDQGVKLLNSMVEKRWDKNSFQPYTSNNREDLIKKVLLERRKQLLRRGLRWSDLRRLNKEADYSTEIKRRIDFQGKIEEYELLPNAIEYTYPIPISIMEWGGYEQNPI